jgi:thioredoxin-related protein
MQKLLLILILINLSFANKDSNLTIFNSYTKAIDIAKEQKKPIFILFSKKNCQWCSRLKADIYKNNELKKKTSKRVCNPIFR